MTIGRRHRRMRLRGVIPLGAGLLACWSGGAAPGPWTAPPAHAQTAESVSDSRGNLYTCGQRMPQRWLLQSPESEGNDGR